MCLWPWPSNPYVFFNCRRSFSMLFTRRPVRPRAIWPPHFERKSVNAGSLWDSKKTARNDQKWNKWQPPLSLRSRKRKLQLKLPHASEASFHDKNNHNNKKKNNNNNNNLRRWRTKASSPTKKRHSETGNYKTLPAVGNRYDLLLFTTSATTCKIEIVDAWM